MRLWLACLLLLPPMLARAAGGEVSAPDGRRVHYGTINTAQLDAAVARRLEVQPDAGTALIVLSPRDPEGRSIGASAEGSVRRLTGQRQVLDFRTRGEPGQRDLVAVFEIPDGERLVFEIRVRLEGLGYPLEIDFNQSFYRGS